MNAAKYVLVTLLFLCLLSFSLTNNLFAQEEGKGDLEDFTDDYGEEESESSDSDDDDLNFFLYVIFDNMADLVRLWGGTPGTAFGPFPSFPYAEGDGFMTLSDEYRSYYFNTEFSYHHLNENLRSYNFKWETQFLRSSKLSFDLAVYEEDRIDEFGLYKDHLTFFGARYGYAVYRSPQMLVNVEGGFRGLYRNVSHGGPEIAVDLQLFPKRPLIIETELAAAYIFSENSGPLYTVESSAGIALGRFEILAGLRVLKNKSADLLDGFRVGLRIWY